MEFKLTYSERDSQWRLQAEDGTYWSIKYDFANLKEAIVGLLESRARKILAMAKELEKADA